MVTKGENDLKPTEEMTRVTDETHGMQQLQQLERRSGLELGRDKAPQTIYLSHLLTSALAV